MLWSAELNHLNTENSQGQSEEIQAVWQNGRPRPQGQFLAVGHH